MKIEYGSAKLMTQVAGTIFTNLPLALLQVFKHIATMAHFHDYVHQLMILEDVQESHNVRMLAHLEDFDLSVLQEMISFVHLLLVNDLDGHLLVSLDVRRQLNEAEFAVPESVLDVVVLLDFTVAHSFLDFVHPADFVLFGLQVVNTFFMTWVDKLKGMQLCRGVKLLNLLILDEHTNKGIHLLVACILLALVDVEFAAKQRVVVLFEFPVLVLAVHNTIALHLISVVINIERNKLRRACLVQQKLGW